MSLKKAWLLAATRARRVRRPCGADGRDRSRGRVAGRPSATPSSPSSSPPTPPARRRRAGSSSARTTLRLSPTQPTSSNPDQVEVAEVFWYGCPHCYELDPLLERWREQAPDYVNFVRVPAVWNPTLQIHARAFYTAEALGKGAEMHAEFFREIHERRNGLDTEAKLQEFFGRFDVDAAAFKTAFDSFAVQAKLQRADELNRRYRIDSVPTIIVNGKYTTDGPMAGSYEELLVLVDELVAAEREAR